MSRAVLYLRVSTEDQVKNLSLDVQERACRDYCTREGWSVGAVYREEGESARTEHRTQLQRMLTALREQQGRTQYLVVYDLSRFARDQFVHLTLKRLLASLGVSLRSATQPIQDDENGRLLEGVLAVLNQWENEIRAKKVREGVRETTARGRWPRRAPLGYLNARGADGAKTIIPDPDRAPLIRTLYELVAAGEAPADAQRRVLALGLRSWSGRQPDLGSIVAILRSPFYAGRVSSPAFGIDTPGLHQAIIDRETWLRVQIRLAGRLHAPESLRRPRHPDFPLRGLVRCAACGKPLTASKPRGKGGKRYPFYRCWFSGCNAVNVRGEVLEARFEELLQKVQLQPRWALLAEEVIRDTWREDRHEAAQRVAAARRRAEDLRLRRERLVEAFVYRQAIDAATYQRELAQLEEAATIASLELHDEEADVLDIEASLAAVRPLLTRAAALWHQLPDEERRRFQALIFPEGVQFDGRALGTPRTAAIYMIGQDLQKRRRGKNGLVVQIRSGWNSILPWLRTAGELAARPEVRRAVEVVA